MGKLGLLVTHYGTPAGLEDVLPYYTHIRRGRPPSAEQLEELTERYRAIGGPSPLTEISARQAAAIGDGLRRRGAEVEVFVGAKHAQPFVADGVGAMAEAGVERAVGVVLAPHYSEYSVGAYRRTALAARDAVRPEMKLEFVERWGAEPALIEALASRVLERAEGWDLEETLVVFTAHSLPSRIVADGDPYEGELLETSRLVAQRSGVPRWAFAYQSASNTGEPWLGPDVLEVIEREAGRCRKVIACTVGFVSEHLEVLYDLGVEARGLCERLGLGFRLARCVNDDPAVMDAVAGLAFGLLECA